MTNLPGRAGEIEEIIGLERTVALLKARGGTEITIPKNANNTVLSTIIGIEATELLILKMGYGKIELPCANMRGRDADRVARKNKAIEMLNGGKSHMETALACELSLQAVKKYARELRQEREAKTQGSLDL